MTTRGRLGGDASAAVGFALPLAEMAAEAREWRRCAEQVAGLAGSLDPPLLGAGEVGEASHRFMEWLDGALGEDAALAHRTAVGLEQTVADLRATDGWAQGLFDRLWAGPSW